LEKLLSSNLELLKEPNGQYFCNFLFLISLQHKTSTVHDYGWKFNIYVTIKLLDELEMECIKSYWNFDNNIELKTIKEYAFEKARSKAFF
jgi:hypothetical protein